LEEDPFVQTDQYSDQELPQAPDLGPSIDGPGYQEAQPIEPFSDPDSLEGPHLEEASLAPEADSGPPDLVAEIVPITTIEPSEEIPQIDQIEPQPTTLDIMLEATAAPEPPNLDVTTLDDDINQLDARPLEPKQPQGPPEPPEITATAVSDQDASDPRSATQVVAPRATPMTEPLKVKPMSVLEGRGGVLKASQTQMTTPIAIDQTQMPRVMKEAAASFQSPGQTVTIQDLDVNYQKNTFLNPLEVVYYKLLRSAFTQYLIFPKVTSRATVSISSRNSEHLKVAENVLTNTCISFVICDVKLNIKAVVELVEDGALPSNKDKARDYILKKAGCVLIRFYSADTPPDVSTLRRLLLD
jgi:hypothetical protein